MNLELANSILDILETMQDAVKQMKRSYVSGNIPEFNALSVDLKDGLNVVRNLASQNVEEDSVYRLKDGCTCALMSLEYIKNLIAYNPEEVPWKLDCELLAFIEGTYLKFFYYKIMKEDPERRVELRKRIANTGGFARLAQNIEERSYTCDLSIFMPAYNHLDYSKLCIASILDNLPKGISYELILLNHGSTDGTKEYFESLPGVHIINLPMNRIFPNAGLRALGGRYSLYISNDIVIGKNAIDNMYKAISGHEDYGWIVPATSAVSNLQTITAEYQNMEEFHAFAAKNNIYDETRHEMRVRLCNPVTMVNTDRFYQLQLELYEQMYCRQNESSFPDDKISLWMRRHGYKSILEKDAYCHHFGSITHRNDYNSQQKWDDFYLQGRKVFLKDFGVDPWGTGFCYDSAFRDCVVDKKNGHIEVLGINCGLGGNSLKIKEQIKEYCHNVDTCLSNITDDPSFLPDLKGISDIAETVSTIKELKNFRKGHIYQYIVWETPFLIKYKFRTLLDHCLDILAPDGKLILKLTNQNREFVLRVFPNRKELGDDWVICEHREYR